MEKQFRSPEMNNLLVPPLQLESLPVLPWVLRRLRHDDGPKPETDRCEVPRLAARHSELLGVLGAGEPDSVPVCARESAGVVSLHHERDVVGDSVHDREQEGGRGGRGQRQRRGYHETGDRGAGGNVLVGEGGRGASE